eukprot:Skav200166  [mRNA]  locus=scaffold6219:72521:81249:- [translate_table: standard]
MVTHNWSNLFRDLVASIIADAIGDHIFEQVAEMLSDSSGAKVLEEMLMELLGPKRLPLKLSPHEAQRGLHGCLGKTYWICAFAVNQHIGICGSNPRGDVDPATMIPHPICSCAAPKIFNETPPLNLHGESINCEMNKFDDMSHGTKMLDNLPLAKAGDAVVSANVDVANAVGTWLRSLLPVGSRSAAGISAARADMGGCQGKPAAAETKAPPKKRDSSTIKKDIKDGGIGYAQFIIENTGKIADHYLLDKKKLGEGSYGSVSKATNISTKAIRAVKTISKSQMKNIERFKQEIAIMKMMDHPNIIKLYESFEDIRNIYLVMELCAGGELFDRIIESGHFSEVQAAILMQQIIRAIYYMHENKIAHRDLKPENFLFMTKEPCSALPMPFPCLPHMGLGLANDH